MASYLITGASSGLGLQVALHIARAGQHRLVLPVRDPIRGETLRQTLLAAGARAIDTPPMESRFIA